MKIIMKYIFPSLIFILLSISCSTKKRIAEVRQMFLNAPSENIYNGNHLTKSRRLISNSLDNTIINNDSIIFIEFFDNIHIHYRCCIYTSANYLIKECVIDGLYFTENKDAKVISFEEKNISLNPYKNMIRYFQQQTLDKIKERGDKARYTPNTYIIITFLNKINNTYKTSYIQTFYDPSIF